jgi:hypothetical protein
VTVEVVSQRGWEVVRVSSELISVDVLPGKGGDILAVRDLASGINVLWTTPWGLRARAAVSTAADSQTNFLEHYAGGWQTLFPNGGGPTDHQGAQLPFHGEATLVPWDWHSDTDRAATLQTTLVRSPFLLRRTVSVEKDTVFVAESVTNEARDSQQAMWSHHPAFGAPFLDAHCVLETGARTFLADADYDTPNGDLVPGSSSAWPLIGSRGGDPVDLRRVPGGRIDPVDRFGYLKDFDEAWYSLTSPTTGLTVTVRWDRDAFPFAWYWLEAHGSAGFPWHQRAYVLAVEPAATIPGHGLQVARERGHGLVEFAPGETRMAWVSMQVERA